MARDMLTVCLPPTDPADVPHALAAAMAPFWNDAEIPSGGVWQGEWQWWHVFGGDGADGLAVRAGYEADPRLARNPLWSDGSPRPPQPAERCDGGPRGLLDPDRDRAPAADTAGADWDGWAAFSADFEPALSASVMMAQASDRSAGWAAAFFEQPVIRAVAALRASSEQAPRWARMQDPVAYYAGNREQHVRRKVSRILPTNVLLTLDGEWLDGTCTSSDPNALVGHRYFDFADRYLDALAEDDLMVRIRFKS
ncbi:hypothetical protein ABZW30_46215 [Kitasatospora sp. NPDC004669]|uniref:hypothetical protein n=1 Tax=Kitasatospora sp. NPDC004669 TaxID=3154555 RepID=UPI0033A9A2EE